MSGARLRLAGTNEERLAVLARARDVMREHEEKHLVADFDAAYAERKREQSPHLVRFGGRVFEIPRKVGTDFVMFYSRHCLSRDAKGQLVLAVPEEHIAEFVRRLLGEAFLEVFERERIEFDFLLEHVVPTVLRLWGLDTASVEEKKTSTTPGS